MSDQDKHLSTKELIDDTINLNEGIDLYPEVMDQTSNQLAMANYRSHNSGSQHLPLLSEPVIPMGNMTLQLKDDQAEKDHELVDDKALTRLAQVPSKLKKPKSKKPPSGPKSRPAFVMKIWNMVNDPSNEQFIRWLPDGKSFIVTNRESFMKYILPKYFKHNNFASFVRQLNMYGWHKVQDVTTESIHSSGSGNQESWQFENANFIRDKDDLLDNILRNKSTKEEEDFDFGNLMTELKSVRMNQIAIVEDLRRIRGDNQLLWEEHFAARERHEKQTQALDKIMRFLHQVYGNGNRIEGGNNFNFGDLVQATQGSYYTNEIPQTVPLNQSLQSQPINEDFFEKPRLMLTDTAHKRSPSGSLANGTIQEITSPMDNTSGRNSVVTPGSATSIKTNHPLTQELMDNDTLHGIAPSPRALFPELAHPPLSATTPATDTIGDLHNYNPELLSDPVYVGRVENSIKEQGQKIQEITDLLLKHVGSNNEGDIKYDEYTPSEDSSSAFNVEEFLAPTPQEFLTEDNYYNNNNNNNSDEKLFVPETPSVDGNVAYGSTKRSIPDDFVGTIDEIVDEPESKRRRSGKKSTV